MLNNNFNTSPSLKILGANGGKKKDMELTSIQLSSHIVIDAGNIINALDDEISEIHHIFITHTHLDHIIDIGLLIDTTFDKRIIPLKVYGTKGSIENIKKYIFNWDIWPDFSTINLPNSDLFALEFIEIQLNETIVVDDCKLKAVKNNHTSTSNGYVVTKANKSILITSDTYCCKEIWEEVNTNLNISSIIIDISFPSSMDQLAFDSKHLTPQLLKNELESLYREDVVVYASHIKPSCYEEVCTEIEEFRLLKNGGKVLEKQDIVTF